MSLPTKAVLYAATYPRKPELGAPCNISIAQFNNWHQEELRQAKETAWDEGHEDGAWNTHNALAIERLIKPKITNPYRSQP